MTIARRIALLALTGAFFVACSPDSSLPLQPKAPSLSLAFAELPAPVLNSAVIVEHQDGFNVVRLSFTDTADDETLVNAVFSGADATMTQSIGGTPGTGERTVDVYVLPGYATAQLQFRFEGDYATTCKCMYGPLSNAVAITDAGTVTAAKKKGHK